MSKTDTASNNNYPKRVDCSQLQAGDYLSEVQYYQVVEVNQNSVKLRDRQGIEPIVDRELVEAMYSANQYTKEVIVTRTELIDIFTHSYNVVFTVNFNKQFKEDDLTQKLVSALSDLEEIKGNSKQVKSLLKKIVKENMEGEERTLIGYLIQPETSLGRSKVIDLEIPLDKMQIRYVDHRTLNWLIVKNVKYTVQSSSKTSKKSSDKSSTESESSDKVDVDLSQKDLSGADLRGADLSNRNLQSYNFTKANLGGANLSHSDLSECSFLKANLSHANLSFAKLNCTDFTEADLSNSDLSYSSPEEQYSIECYFTKANLTNANLQEGNFEGSYFNQTNLTEVNLYKANLENADLTEASIVKADLREVNLQSAILTRTKFDHVDLSNANLSWSELTEVNLENVDLRNADLSWSEFTEVNLESVNLDGANLEDVKYDDNCKFPRDIEALLKGGIWIDDDKFVKFEEIAYLEVSASFDDVADYLESLGLRQELSKLLEVSEDETDSYDETYSYSDIQMSDIKISVSDLDFGGWEYEDLHIGRYPEIVKRGSWLYQLADAIESGEVELSIFLYT